jgi:NDP-sugar pyrophosphorylase family protein
MSGEEPVSMNMWGFTPTLFEELGARLPAFLDQIPDNPKAEFLLPEIVDDLIQSGTSDVYALYSDDKWLGVTYPEDKAAVAKGIRALVDAGAYPANLWG